MMCSLKVEISSNVERFVMEYTHRKPCPVRMYYTAPAMSAHQYAPQV
jgi:hypothetical protein